MMMEKLFTIVPLDIMDHIWASWTLGAQNMFQMKWGIKSMKLIAPRAINEEFHKVGTCGPSLSERSLLVTKTRRLVMLGWMRVW